MSDEECTIFCRNLSEKVTEPILFELFLQAGPIEDVRIPLQDGRSRNFGFIQFKHKCSVKYAIDLFRETKLYGKGIILQNRILEAERDAELKSRLGRRNGECNSLRGGPLEDHGRKDEVNALRGGPLQDYRRKDEVNSLRGAPLQEYRRKDEVNALRGGPPASSSRSAEINMLRGGAPIFSRNNDNTSLRGGSRLDQMAPRGLLDNYLKISPRSSDPSLAVMDMVLQNPYASRDLLYQSQSSDRGQSRHNRDNLRYDHSSSRHNRDSSRRDHDHRPDKQSDSGHHRRRSRSRDRSPVPYRNSDKHRHHR